MSTTAAALQTALEFHRRGELNQAEAIYRSILAADERSADAWHLLGLIHHARDEHPQALEAIRRAIALDGAQASFHLHLAEVHRAIGQRNEAEAACGRALALQPTWAVAYNTLGAIQVEAGEPNQAADSFRRALAIDPQLAIAAVNLGGLLHEAGHLHEAIACYRRALEIDPRDAEAHFHLGTILQRQGQLDDAAACYARAIQANPEHALAYNNLGTLHKSRHNLEQAIACYGKALELQPNFAEVLNNLGNVFKTQGRWAEAGICYDQTLRIRPEHAQARYNRGLMALAEGDLAAGWPDYEARHDCPGFAHREFHQPRWDGRGNQTVLIHAEQGLGDTLQFVRYLPLVAELGCRLIFESPAALMPLLRQSGYNTMGQLVARGDALPEFDAQLPLLSLPGLFATTFETIPSIVPYLSVDAGLVHEWSKSICVNRDFKIGIAWQGSLSYPGDRFRSIPLAQFAPLAQHGVELISLQKGPGTEQLAGIAGQFRVRELGNDLDTERGAFMDTAAVMRNLNLVITSDSAIAHLAGALGVRVWLALPLVPDWRWMLDCEDSPWYPTMRLFRQERFDDWQPVFARMAQTLRAMLAKRGRFPGEIDPA